MKWTVLNAFGGLAWLAGLSYAKGMTLPAAGLTGGDEHRLLIGALMGAMGLVVLLWANLRSAA